MEYFLTGATGFVGGHLVDELLDDGHDVVALVRTPAAVTTLPDSVEIVEGDVTDKESMREAMAGVDGVFHLAAWYTLGASDVETAERVNVDGTRNVLELVSELDVPKAVYTSTLAVNGDTDGVVVDESYRYEGPHLSLYDRTKHAAHYEVAEPMAEAGLPLVTVMPGVVYGPGDRGPLWLLWEAYLQGDLPVIPRKSGYTWGHVEDIARAHVRAMEAGEPGEEYIIAGEPHTLVEAFAVAEEATGIDAPRTVPPSLFRGLSRVMGVVERVVTPPPSYRAEALRVLGGATYYGDNSKATEELGLEHRPFADGLGETLTAELAALESEPR